MRINIVVAISDNTVIGRDGGLPWRLSSDLRQFKSVTMGHPLIMGRKTHESIGRALPGRLNVVVSRQRMFSAPGCTVVDSLDKALVVAGDVAEVMIVGGATLYAAAIDMAERIYLTEVHVAIEGNVVFPNVDWNEWKEISRARHPADAENEVDYSFVTFDRVSGLHKRKP
jgi:dihydrofolate reductase